MENPDIKIEKKSTLREIITIIIIAVVILWPARSYIAQPFVVSGASMDNTFQNGNYLIIDELSYRFENPKRGDVIVFVAPEKALVGHNESLGFFGSIEKFLGIPVNTHFIKRVIGLPGETVEINNDQIKITTGSTTVELNEPYISSTTPDYISAHEKVTLGANEYFVMGDNRHNSSDSRTWGVLPRKNITGRALLRLLPINEIKIFPGEHNNY